MPGIYNPELIDAANKRPARAKLQKMGGILASSPELMEAASSSPVPDNKPIGGPFGTLPSRRPTSPSLMGGNPLDAAINSEIAKSLQSPQPVMGQVTPQPVPMPVPSVKRPASPAAPMRFQPGGPVDIQETPDSAVSRAPTGSFQTWLLQAGEGLYQAVMGKYGSEKAAEEAGQEKRNQVQDAAKTGNTSQIADAVMVAAEVTPNKENKQEFVENVFGLTDVNDIDQINDRIARVAIASSFGKRPDEFAQAVLLGLNSYKATAASRAGGGGGGEKARQEYLYNSTYQETFRTALEEEPEDFERANRMAREAARRAAPNAPSARPQASDAPQGSPTLEQFLIAAQAQNPDKSVEELTEYYNNTYGG